MMLFVGILTFLSQVTGDTFFREFQKGNHTLSCNKSAHGGRIVWYEGNADLMTFKPKGCGQQKKHRLRCQGEAEPFCEEREMFLDASSAGGIFACTKQMQDKTQFSCPLFSSTEHCSAYDFFMVAITGGETEEVIPRKSSENGKIRVPAGGHFTLSCEFQLKSTSTKVVVNWIRDTNPNICLSSAITDYDPSNVVNDINCCIDAMLKERRWVSRLTGSSEHHYSQNITIFNATSSDRGLYYCIVSTFSRKYMWKIVSTTSVEVGNPNLPWHSYIWISVGAIGGIALIGGITWLLCWKKKSKGNPSELHQSDQNAIELEEDDCSPYAIAGRNDIFGPEVVYSLATSPGVPPDEASSVPDGKTDSKGEPEHNMQPVYAVVNK